MSSDGRAIPGGERVVLEVIRTAELLARVGQGCVFNQSLSQSKFNILLILKYYGDGGMAQKDILARMVSTKGNLSTHIKSLAADGYVRKGTSTVDRRHDVLSLTRKGARAIEQMEPEYMRHIQSLTSGLSTKGAARVNRELEALQERCRQLLNETDSTTEISL